jgi:hypothetical protein
LKTGRIYDIEFIQNFLLCNSGGGGGGGGGSSSSSSSIFW